MNQKLAFSLVLMLFSLAASSELLCDLKPEHWWFMNKNVVACVIKKDVVVTANSTMKSFPNSDLYAQALKMTSNKDFKYLPINLAGWSPNLKGITFFDCAISSIGDHFKGLQELIELHLSSNHIESITSDAFIDNVKLEWLNLGSNKLTSVSSEQFKSLSNLRVLDIKENQIEALKSPVFDGLTNLQELNLSHNKLKLIDANIFQSLSVLKKLEVNNNQIESIALRTFEVMKHLEFVGLGENKCINKNYEASDFNLLINDTRSNCTTGNIQDIEIRLELEEIKAEISSFKKEIYTEIKSVTKNLDEFKIFMEIMVKNTFEVLKTEIESFNSKHEENEAALKAKLTISETKIYELNEKAKKLEKNLETAWR